MDLAWLDSLEFEAIPTPVNYAETPRLSVNKKGQMSMNAAFLRAVGNDRRFYGEVSKEGHCLTLRPDGEGQICFTPKGVRLNGRLAELLRARQVKIPAVYSMEWIPERGLWAGRSGDLSDPPPVSTLLPKRRGGKRNGK